jgi:hypothetical protein
MLMGISTCWMRGPPGEKFCSLAEVTRHRDLADLDVKMNFRRGVVALSSATEQTHLAVVV